MLDQYVVTITQQKVGPKYDDIFLMLNVQIILLAVRQGETLPAFCSLRLNGYRGDILFACIQRRQQEWT